VTRRFQVLVIGSGFAGSLVAMVARRLGLSTALVERGRHPRFAIGESSTPLANLLLEQIACEYDLPGVAPLCKWGTWQKATPRLACGLKRGFTFYHHQLGRPFEPDPERGRQLLVGASPSEEIADTHWLRSDLDYYLVQQAQSMGVAYWDNTNLTDTQSEPSGMRLSGNCNGRSVHIKADFVLDASGPRGFLFRNLALREKPFPSLPPTQTLFSHFVDVSLLPGCFSIDSLIPPYPPEQAAVHHIFDGGWVWVLKFNNGVTSAGIAAKDRTAEALALRSGAPAWQKVLDQLPSLRESFCSSQNILPYFYQPRLAFQSEHIIGQSWAMLPSAAGVVDPLLSTGFPLTLFGVLRLARILKADWGRPSFFQNLTEYARVTAMELEATSRLVGALYSSMANFNLFKSFALLYFAAASFSETARRLGKFHLSNSFLLCDHSVFSKILGNACATSCQTLSEAVGKQIEKAVYQAIQDFDVAGLTNPSRHSWFPSTPQDIVKNGWKLDASHDEILTMLRKSGINLEHL
jgi:FADH2 O2-dependent halogenase